MEHKWRKKFLSGVHNHRAIKVSRLLFILLFLGIFLQPAAYGHAGDLPVIDNIDSSSDLLSPESSPVNQSVASSTATVLIFDTSDSMNSPDASGVSKLQAAITAGSNILDIIEAENRMEGTVPNQVGIVSFKNHAEVNTDLTSNLVAAKSAIRQIYADGSTGMPDGLLAGLDVLSTRSPGVAPIVILMSDGLPNVGHGNDRSLTEEQVKQQVLELAAQARQEEICIYTVGFGIPLSAGSGGGASIDEDFLREIPRTAGCGEYFNARNASQLANIYAELRHISTGTVLLQETGEIAQGEEKTVGTANVSVDQEYIVSTVNWPGSKVVLRLKDPNGRTVDNNYPGATISTSTTIMTIIVTEPIPGAWVVEVVGVEIPTGTTTYNAILSTRAKPAQSVIVTPQPPFTPTSGSTSLIVMLLALGCIGLVIFLFMQTKSRVRPKTTGTPSGPRVKLVGISGAATGQTYVVFDNFVIGRGAACHISVNDPAASRQHALIGRDQWSWYIQDMGSKGGTVVNGQRITSVRLNSGDNITIGKSVFTFNS